MPVLAPLNPEQQDAVRHPPADGPLLVSAGAGTGKTLTLASRLAWLVQQGADNDQQGTVGRRVSDGVLLFGVERGEDRHGCERGMQ